METLRHQKSSLRQLAARVASLLPLVVATALASTSFAKIKDGDIQVRSLQCVDITVDDMNRSLAFYTHVLPFRKVSDVELAGADYEKLEGIFGLRMRVVDLKLGNETLELTEYLTPKGRPYPPDVKSNDRSFQHVAIIVRSMAEAYASLKKRGVRYASTGPQRLPDWNKSAGGIEAFYFKDPDGHTLEILQFPSDKGPEKWHKTTRDLFLGIDHTAIVVNNSDESLKLYREVLGFKVAGESMNYGIEQEHLNNVEGAKLRITRMSPPAGPSVEFLEYLNPRDGKPAPSDTKATDLWHWQTRFVVNDVAVAIRTLSSAGYSFVSKDSVQLKNAPLGFSKAATFRDADGHEIQIVSSGAIR